MFRKCMAILMILCFSIVPVAEGSEPLRIHLDFNQAAEQQLGNFATYYGTKLEAVSTYDGKGACISGGEDSISVARLEFGETTQTVLNVSQTIYAQSNKETQIRIMSGSVAVAVLSLLPSQIKALGKNGWIRLRAVTQDTWYRLQISLDFVAKRYEVSVDGIKLGGSISCLADANSADSVQYSIVGDTGRRLYIDDISVVEGKAAVEVTGGSDASVTSKNAYYGTYKARFDSYVPPEENVVEREWVTGDAKASSTAEGYSTDSLIDGDSTTKWQAAPAVSPVDNGKSLNFNKIGATDGTQLARYRFSPVKGTVILEQDILASDVTNEKALPYMFASDGTSIVAPLMIIGGNFQMAGTSVVYRDISADTWYHIKIVMRTQTQSYDVYVNDALWCQDIDFRAPCTDIAMLQYHMGSSSMGSFCVDNIKLSYKSPLESFENIILEEDFESVSEESDTLDGWQLSHSTSGQICVKSFGKLSEYKFTQYVNLDVGRESEFEGAYIEIPDGVSIKYTVDTSRKNGVYVKTLERNDKFYSGVQTLDFSPVRAQHLRITIYDAIDAMGNTVHAQLSEVKIIMKHRTPVDNLAFYADVAVSGEMNVTLDKRGINDNIIAEFGRIGDWQSGKEQDKWVELSWYEPQTVNKIILHDSASMTEWTKSGIVSFDDGSSVEIKDIRNSGYPCAVEFETKTIKKLRFTITDFEGGGGLSELQVYAPGGMPDDIEYVEPDKRIVMNKDYYGRWICVNDVDGDGELEYLSARVYNDPLSDNHSCASICVQKEDGTVLWTWGEPTIGTHAVGSDLPMQVYDLDNDGDLEVLTCSKTELYILDAKTGKEIRRHKLPQSEKYPKNWSSDTIIIADISGKGYPSDIMVKTRYTDVWAYTSDWEPIWHVCYPDGMKVGHYPQPIDADNDGHDEVIVGYVCVDDDGSYYWSMKEEQYPGLISRGHKDSLEIINFVLTGDATGDMIINKKDLDLLNKHISREIILKGNQFTAADTTGDGKIDEEDKKLLEQKLAGNLLAFPNKGIPKEEQRFCISPCGGGSNIIMIDGNGNRVWSLDDATHYETVEKANLGLDEHPYQIIVTNINVSNGVAPIEIVDLDGNILGSRYSYMRNRQLNPINWLGEGKEDFIFMPTDNIVIDGEFNVRVKPLAPYRGYDTMGMKSYQTGDKKYTCDMDGDGTTDIASITHEDDTIIVYIYYNKNGAKVADAPGRGHNISQY